MGHARRIAEQGPTMAIAKSPPLRPKAVIELSHNCYPIGLSSTSGITHCPARAIVAKIASGSGYAATQVEGGGGRAFMTDAVVLFQLRMTGSYDWYELAPIDVAPGNCSHHR